MLRLRQAAPALLLAASLLALSACGQTEYPNSTFNHNTDFNTSIDALWDRLLFWGTIVFVFVEAVLVYTIIKYRKRPGGPVAKQIHGHAALEITWTVIPAVILVLIAVPTVKTIFETQAPAPAGSLKVEVIGHQWWWEFRYPELGITTANELYVPVGRTVAFELRTVDVLHSFWIPQMGGKRDLITNKSNFMWFTPNADLGTQAWNGFCVEYCGDSHANMKFRLFTVQPAEFESWAAHQAKTAQVHTPGDSSAPGYMFPKEQLKDHIIPKTPIPAGLTYDDALLAGGNATRGQTAFMIGGCVGCHSVGGNPVALPANAPSVATTGPNLTHVASRHTIGGGLFPNDPHHLARWIKNAQKMKPGSKMNVIGKGEYDINLKQTVSAGLTDQQIADVVAYLATLK
jgi:cytochrome c oxidase subunit 2